MQTNHLARRNTHVGGGWDGSFLPSVTFFLSNLPVEVDDVTDNWFTFWKAGRYGCTELNCFSGREFECVESSSENL